MFYETISFFNILRLLNLFLNLNFMKFFVGEYGELTTMLMKSGFWKQIRLNTKAIPIRGTFAKLAQIQLSMGA